jgi:ElaB/YqjD/DUF883 family membrane-anchored ribosome-binding protein
MATAEDDLERLRRDVHQLRADISALVADVKDVSAQQRRAAVDRAREAGESLVNEAEAWRARADQHIEQNPLMSVLISFGVGYILGRLFDRRR